MKKILLTSASKVFLRRNSNLLLRKELELFTETSGAKALHQHKEKGFDLILSDLQLEDMGGCTLCSMIRKLDNRQDVPVILTCHNIMGSKERIEQSGASAVLLKPIDPIQLMETIGSFLDLPLARCKRVVLNVKVLSKKLDLEFFCFSHDISNTGILLETEHQLALGSRITCQFTLPGSSRIEVDGEIIRTMNTWEYNKLYGIKFIDMPFSSQKAISSYVTSAIYSGAGELPPKSGIIYPLEV